VTLRVKLEDLPPKVRKQVKAATKKPKRSTVKLKRCKFRCCTCDELLDTWAAVERHDMTHSRIECEFSAHT